jgi:hypothetical protein
MNCPYCKKSLQETKAKIWQCINTTCKVVTNELPMSFEPYQYSIPVFNQAGLHIGKICGYYGYIRGTYNFQTKFIRKTRFGPLDEIIMPYRWLCLNDSFDYELEKLIHNMCSLHRKHKNGLVIG